MSESGRKHYWSNRASVRTKQADYYRENAEKIRRKSREWYAANRDAALAQQKLYREAKATPPRRRIKANPRKHYVERENKYRAENAAKINARRRALYAQNAERERERSKQWNHSNRDTRLPAARKYKAENPDVVSANKRARKARERQAEGHHTIADVKGLWLKQGEKCGIAGCKYPISDTRRSEHMYHVDHVIPLSPRKGGIKGTNWPSNLQILCKTHNQQKHNSDPEDWQARMSKKELV